MLAERWTPLEEMSEVRNLVFDGDLSDRFDCLFLPEL